MKVKIFKNWVLDDLENATNDFIEKVKVIDIKFSVNENYSFAMIIYEEKR